MITITDYRIDHAESVEEFIDDLDQDERERILKRIDKLKERPKYYGEKRDGFWILKIGRSGYRLAFGLKEDDNLIETYAIEKRGSSNYERKFY